MADVMLAALTLLAISLSIPALLETKNVLRLDVAAGLMTLSWLLPQCYALRDDPFSWYFDLSFTYGYIFVCLALLAFGSTIGRKLAERNFVVETQTGQDTANGRYDFDKLANAALAMTGLGGAAFVLMAREAQNFGLQEQWTGVITLYFLLSQFMIFGGALGILLFMQSKNKRGLIAYLAMILVAAPVFVLLVRRAILFQIAAITLGAVVLNKGVKVPRTVLAVVMVISILILNGAGSIRQHIFHEGGTIVTAFTEGVMFKENAVPGAVVAAELKSAVSDIEIARATNHFKPFVMVWNTAVSQYVPKFIVGEEFKSSLLLDDDYSSIYQSYFQAGATRTGFAESFTGYWYFGPLIYLAIGLFFGRLWFIINKKDIRAQYTYLVFLLYSLLTITESISRVVVTAPIILLSIWLSFKYAERRPLADGADRRMSLPR